MIPNKTLKNGFSISAYGIGTYYMGGPGIKVDPDYDPTEDRKALHTAIELGITHIDTAEIYALGKSEELIGEVLKSHDRKKLFIASKAYSTHLHHKDLKAACFQSLERLGTDYLDLYMPHSFNKEVPLEETAQALAELVEERVVRHIGVSNYSTTRLKAIQRLLPHPVVANQVHYNLKYREPELTGLLDYCQKSDVMLVAWRPVQFGKFDFNSVPQVQEIAKKYSKTPTQVAINWLTSQTNVVTLSKTRSIDHLKENIDAVSWQMEAEDLEFLRREFPEQEAASNAIPIGA